jgi:hypothetical protein
LDQVSRSLSPEDGVGSVVEIVEQVLDLWDGVQGVVAVVFQVFASVLGDLAGAPTLHAGDVELGKSASSHLVMIAALNRVG